jgi:hypothetical protein
MAIAWSASLVAKVISGQEFLKEKKVTVPNSAESNPKP